MPQDSTRRRIAVIGGGIAGLAAAHRLTEIEPNAELRLLEAGSQLGGVLQTEEIDGYLVERAADMFLTNPPWAINLCRRIGFVDELISPSEQNRGSFVVHGGRLRRIPEGFVLMQPRKLWPLVTSPILSPWGKLRMLAEWFVPRRKETSDESLASFVRRRLGDEAYDRLVDPLISGIYTADGEQLSLAATMPRFIEMERQHGGLIRAAFRQQPAKAPDASAEESGARYSMFMTPRRGMSSLVSAIAAKLPRDSVYLGARVERLTRTADNRWQIEYSSSDDAIDFFHNSSAFRTPRSEFFDAIIIALPSAGAAKLLTAISPSLSQELSAIESASSAVVVIGCRRDQLTHPLDGFGFVVPATEKRAIIAGSFSSVKFPGRAPEGRVLLRVFSGGARRPELAVLPDEELRRVVCGELGQLIGLSGEPELFRIVRWREAMPQYHLGHLDRVRRIEEQAAQLPGLALAGAAYRGVGIPDSIRSGEQAAETIRDYARHA